MIRHRRRYLAVRTGLDVAEIADVTIVVRRSAVLLAERIEMRTGGSAAVRQITELNNKQKQSGTCTKRGASEAAKQEGCKLPREPTLWRVD